MQGERVEYHTNIKNKLRLTKGKGKYILREKE